MKHTPKFKPISPWERVQRWALKRGVALLPTGKCDSQAQLHGFFLASTLNAGTLPD